MLLTGWGRTSTTMPDFDHPEMWRREALCAQTDPELFFPEKGENNLTAKGVCNRCNVRAQCLDYALNNDEPFGIWGGRSTQERDRIKKERPATFMSRTRAMKHSRDAAIIAMAEEQVGVQTIATEIGITDRTVHRVLAAHRSNENKAGAA